MFVCADGKGEDLFNNLQRIVIIGDVVVGVGGVVVGRDLLPLVFRLVILKMGNLKQGKEIFK